MLRAVAEEKPLLLSLDDLQWADAASIGLLFHLGRRLADARILIACIYRPEEIIGGTAGGRHPLAKALGEFKRIFGDVWLNLGQVEQVEGRRFVDSILDSEPNRLGDEFRAALFQRTGGHPLFTVELLRAMQERGDLLKDANGRWIAGAEMDWRVLPARVEAVIEERIGRLNPELQEILTVASVEGEVFTAQVVAKVQKVEEGPMLRRLSQELGRRHRLVKEKEETQTGRGRISRFRFSHVLFQDYLYWRLSWVERRLLHKSVAAALENLYEGQPDGMAVQLAHHFHLAGDYDRALRYFTLAAERAARIYANDEAIAHYTRAIDVVEREAPDVVTAAKLYRGRGGAYATLGEFDRALADQETVLLMAQSAGDGQLEWRALIDLGKLWASRDYNQTHGYFERALELARRMDEPALLAGGLNRMGNWFANDEKPVKAITYHQKALQIFEELEDQQNLANTLDLLGIAHLLAGDFTASVGYYEQAIALFRELDDRPRLTSSLMGRAVIVTAPAFLASVPAVTPADPLRDFREAVQIAREIGSFPDEAWSLWFLGLFYTVHGDYGQALEAIRRGLQIASEIGHREWVVGNRFALGVLYGELLAPEEARRELEQALALTKELRSQYWINHATGALATAYFLLDDLPGAQSILDTVISRETPMDTTGKRYCWARRAELALAQGEPAVALAMTERLIDSAAGLAPDRVITFLWLLKGEALAAMGHADEAAALLRAAIENARTTGERFLLWRAQATLGRLYRATGRQAEAGEEFSTARALIEEIAVTIPDEALQDNFRRQALSHCRPQTG
jgi:tetratricopeptide (TPR) repeat protein